MTLILRPIGRGNWSPLQMQFDERRHKCLPVPMEAKVGLLIPIAGRVYRIARVLP